jgi:hypothetical protein
VQCDSNVMLALVVLCLGRWAVRAVACARVLMHCVALCQFLRTVKASPSFTLCVNQDVPGHRLGVAMWADTCRTESACDCAWVGLLSVD